MGNLREGQADDTTRTLLASGNGVGGSHMRAIEGVRVVWTHSPYSMHVYNYDGT